MSRDQIGTNGAYIEKGAEWQLWVIGGDIPHVRCRQVIDKFKPDYPCVIVDFFDWDLNATPSPDLFTIKKTDDAKEIELMKDIAKQ